MSRRFWWGAWGLFALHLLAVGAALALSAIFPGPRRELAYYVHQNGVGRILLTDVSRGLTVTLLQHNPYVVSLAWSPDGSALAFIAYDNSGAYRPYVLALASRDMLAQAQNSSNTSLNWSPDGRWLAFNGYVGPRPTIHLVDAYSRETYRLSHAAVSWNAQPTWSPDSAYLVFAGKGESVDIFRTAVTCLDADCHLDILIDDPASDRQPLWSPDGEWLAFVSDRAGPAALFVTPAQAPHSAPLHISDLTMISTAMSWRPDGQALAFTNAPERVGSAVFVALLDCADCPARIHRISPPELVESSPDWSPDGRILAYVTRNQNTSDVALLDTACLEDGRDCAAARRLLTWQAANVWSPVWRPG